MLSVHGVLASHQTNALIFERNGNISSARAYGATAGDGIFTIQAGGGGGSADAEVARFAGNTVTVNDLSNNVDFRVESDSNANMLFVDASANSIGIGTSGPNATLDVSGRIQFNAIQGRGGDGYDTLLGRVFKWQDGNSGAAGAAWFKIGTITLPDASFSSISMRVRTFYPGSNYGNYTSNMSSWENQCSVTRKTTSVIDAGRIFGPLNNKLRLHRNSIGEWELQGRAEYDNQAVGYEVETLSSSGGSAFVLNEAATYGTLGGTVVIADGFYTYNKYVSDFFTYGEAIFNDGGGNNDFRVESDTNSSMLFVDAGNDRVVIGGTTQAAKLTVQGGTTTENTMFVYGQATGKGGRIVSIRDTRATVGTDGSAGLHFTSSPGTDYVLAKYYDGSVSNFMLTDQLGNEYISVESASNIVINQGGSSSRDFRVESSTTTHALFVDAGSNRVSIDRGTSAIEKFEVGGAICSTYQATNFNTGSYRMSMDLINATKIGRLGTISGSSTPVGTEGQWSLNVNGSEIARLTADGITFGGDTAAANALDDYEEGTWTPSMPTEGGTSYTLSTANGYYRKVGSLVHVEADITFTAEGSGTITLITLPFTPRGNTEILNGYVTSGANRRSIQLTHYSGANVLVRVDDGAAFQNYWTPKTTWSPTNSFRFTGTYIANA